MQSTEMRESRGFVQEMKFLISSYCAGQILEWSRARMTRDIHGGGPEGDQYRVRSLCLDTGDFAVYRGRASYGRAKYRVRRYGPNEMIFLERKLKACDRVGKLRSTVPLREAGWLGGSDVPAGWAGRWFHRRTRVRGLAPVCQISYERTARQAVSRSGPVRLTVDAGLRATPACGYAFAEDGGAVLLAPAQRILELKYRMELPGLFEELMREFALRPARSSKYRLAVEALGLMAGDAGRRS